MDSQWSNTHCGKACPLVLAEFRDEAKRLGNREISLHLNQWCAFARVFLENASSPLIHARIHAAHSVLWACDFHQEYRFLQSWGCCEFCSEACTPRWWHDLTCSTVNGIRVQCNIHQVETDGTHVFITKGTLLRCPLERARHMLLDLEEILDGLCRIHDDIWSVGLRSPTPNLARFSIRPLVLFLPMYSALPPRL